MAVRVEAADVKEILDTSLTDATIETFISAASMTVSKYLDGVSSLTALQLKEIERWLAAHLIACSREKQVKSEAAGDASVSYQGVTGSGLDATLYGQQVKLLDTSGILAAQVGRRAASIYAVTSFDDAEA